MQIFALRLFVRLFTALQGAVFFYQDVLFLLKNKEKEVKNNEKKNFGFNFGCDNSCYFHDLL
jgi:hypothetical protein